MNVPHLVRAVILCIVFTSDVPPIIADPGQPVAIRRSDGCYVVETMWNLAVQVITGEQFRSTQLPGVDLIWHATDTATLPMRLRFDARQSQEFDRTLDRPPNHESLVWDHSRAIDHPTSNAIRIRRNGNLIILDVDGVKITFANGRIDQLTLDQKNLVSGSNALVLTGDHEGETGSAASQINAPLIVVAARSSSKSIGNTIALRSDMAFDDRKLVALDARPLTLPEELEKLMTAKEIACRNSQAVFAKLSANQLNFKPSNGTHTPRWNAEHMMGRELLFFSQIYSALEPGIPVMDLNPKQMPTDYVPRHPDWNGREEARQMERVSSFTSRFSYLLKDIPLDQRAPGSRWKLRGLLEQMERHYNEHTANVKKKFTLPDWPAE